MTYHINPKVYRLQHEIQTLKHHMRSTQHRMGLNNPTILQNYREMIRTREELIIMLEGQQKIPTLSEVVGG